MRKHDNVSPDPTDDIDRLLPTLDKVSKSLISEPCFFCGAKLKTEKAASIFFQRCPSSARSLTFKNCQDASTHRFLTLTVNQVTYIPSLK